LSVPNIPLVEIDPVLAQQLAILLLKCASAMVLLLCFDVLQHGLKLTRAYRTRAIAALPEKASVVSIKCFDPLRGCLLYLLDELSLGDGSRECRDNVDVISNTADFHKVRADVTADCSKISMYARSHV